MGDGFMVGFLYKTTAQTAIRQWLSASEWQHPVAMTLNLKHQAVIETQRGRSFVRLDAHHASQNLRHFLNRLNKHFFGNAGRRFGKRLPVIPTLEGGAGTRFHYHLMLDLPESLELDELNRLIVGTWTDTQWGYGQVQIKTEANDGWLNYITKLRDKIDVGDAIDWTNFYQASLSAH